MNNIYNFFYPKSLCIVGTSSKEKSIGYEILKSVKTYSFTGDVYPVNPKSDIILGYKCYKSILDIDKKIDLAIIVVPKKFVNNSIDHLILKGVKNIVLITAGFKETGEEGKKQEEELLTKLKANNIRMVGPNCMGVINAVERIKLNVTFVAEQPKRGGIGFLSQSGALGAAVLNSLRDTDIRISQFISIGNKADVTELDLLKFWLSDENIRTIVFYLESFENGLELIKKHTTSEYKKPLIILKAGKTKSGMKAASSHTGALSSNEKITESLLKQFGIIRAINLNEMFNTAKGFEHFSLPQGNKVAVVTNAGGPGILAVDKIEEKGLQLTEFSITTMNKLKELVHPEGSVNNPVDLLPGGTPEVFKKVNKIILEDNNVDSIISIFVEPVMVNAFEVIESVNSIKSNKPIYQVCMPLPEFWDRYLTESKFKIPIFKIPEDPAEVISNVLLYERRKDQKTYFYNTPNFANIDRTNAYFLNQHKVENLCKLHHIPMTDSRTVSVDEINENDNYNFPIVVKGLSDKVVHKSELNAVKINIKNMQELNIAVEEIRNSFSNIELNLDEVLLQSFIDIKHELLIGGFRDPSFGPIVMFGSGGKYVEVLDDTKVRSAFLTDKDLDGIITETKIGQIISGVRGEVSVEIEELKEIIKSVAQLMITNEKVIEIDLNPLVIDYNLEFHAIDVRIKQAFQ